jgi:hypothetical protein
MTNELTKHISRVKTKYETWVLGSIKVTYDATKDGAKESTPLAAFILVSCAIDFLAGFMCGITSFRPGRGESTANYKAFVKKYLPQYDPEDVYSNIRCQTPPGPVCGQAICSTTVTSLDRKSTYG